MSKDNEKVRGQRQSHRATTKSKDNDTVSKVQQRQKTKQNKVIRQTRSQDTTGSQIKQGQKKMTKTKSNDKSEVQRQIEIRRRSSDSTT